MTIKQIHGSILLIDDDPLVLMSNVDLLESKGFSCHGVNSIAKAWRTTQNRSFDLIICDHDLSDGKGIQLIERLGAVGLSAPVIYMSAAIGHDPSHFLSVRLVRLVLRKPVDAETLLDSIRTCLNTASASQFPRLIGDGERELLLTIGDDAAAPGDAGSEVAS